MGGKCPPRMDLRYANTGWRRRLSCRVGEGSPPKRSKEEQKKKQDDAPGCCVQLQDRTDDVNNSTPHSLLTTSSEFR
eukprot:scaffold156_cov173-Ochromonas_danica.AAC.17